MADASNHPIYIDRRDAAVIDQLAEGKVYSVRVITRLYKRYTDIRKDKTAKERKNALCESPCMENVGIGSFRFVGTDGGGETDA